MYSREAICKPHARGTRRRGCCRTTASSQDSVDHETKDKKPLESRLPVRTASPTTTALKAVLLRSCASLNDEEKKHGEKAAPESNEILRAKDKVDTLKIKLEDVKWEYERTKAEFEAHEQERVEFRTRHREFDEAERELEELCHSQETQEVE